MEKRNSHHQAIESWWPWHHEKSLLILLWPDCSGRKFPQGCCRLSPMCCKVECFASSLSDHLSWQKRHVPNVLGGRAERNEYLLLHAFIYIEVLFGSGQAVRTRTRIVPKMKIWGPEEKLVIDESWHMLEAWCWNLKMFFLISSSSWWISIPCIHLSYRNITFASSWFRGKNKFQRKTGKKLFQISSLPLASRLTLNLLG